jgi:arabinan endo-1,5-alpha-L-arabinosidase
VISRAIILAMAILIVTAVPARQSHPDLPKTLTLQGDISPIHDPTMIRQGNTYYVFATNRFNGKLLPIFCSQDLQQWKFCGNVFETVPDWALKQVPGARGIWAPDIAYVQGEYRLYYAVSTFGSNHSTIGLITNKTLDAQSKNYRWLDQGPVISTTKDDDFNAIDPHYVPDKEGNGWLAFGSFWGGIKLRKLDLNTGKLSQKDTMLYSLASRRPLTPPAIEAPAILRHDGYYYLFVSFDFCCRGRDSTYKIVVGRSQKINGPYFDREGRALMSGGGTLLMAGSDAWRGPGGQFIFTDQAKDYLVFHSYSAVTNKANLMISSLVWEDGWPRAGQLP